MIGVYGAAGAASAGAAEEPVIDLDPPTSVSLYWYRGDLYGIQWANAHTDAYNQVWIDDGSPAPTTELPPGSTGWGSSQSANTISVRHRIGHRFSEWVEAELI